MTWIFITNQLAKDVHSDDDKSKHAQALLKRAMDFVNKTADLNLTFNYPVRAHQTTDSYTEHVDLGDGIVMDQLNNTVICISDSDDEFDDICDKDHSISVNVISKKIVVQNVDHQTDAVISCCCCTDYNSVFKKYFEGTKIRLCSDVVQCDSVKCLACSQMVERNTLNNHLMKCTKFCD